MGKIVEKNLNFSHMFGVISQTVQVESQMKNYIGPPYQVVGIFIPRFHFKLENPSEIPKSFISF